MWSDGKTYLFMVSRLFENHFLDLAQVALPIGQSHKMIFQGKETP
jgi:hypothetical protein